MRGGISLFSDLLPLPDARQRLKLEDRVRVEFFARRFSDYACTVLDQDTWLDRVDGKWATGDRTMRLAHNGELREFRHE